MNRVYETKYRLEDVYDKKKSQEIATLYLKHWCRNDKNLDFEKAARIWNGGPNGHKKKSTLKYWKKVRKELKKQKGLKNGKKR